MFRILDCMNTTYMKTRDNLEWENTTGIYGWLLELLIPVTL